MGRGAGVLRWVDMLNGDILTLTPAGDIDRLHVGAVAAAMRSRARRAAWWWPSSTASY